MRKLTNNIINILAAVAVTVGAFAAPISASAASERPVVSTVGAWTVSTLASESEGYTIEAYKLDKGLIAWTEINTVKSERKLYVFDGQAIRLLATMNMNAWSEPDAYFYDRVTGSFDVADGVVAWVANDGNDREVFAFIGDKTVQVSDNTYNDKHPIVSRGRIAWTSAPGSTPNLMVREADGRTRKIAQWQVPNYAFSGKVLYWTEKVANRDAFQVIANDGGANRVVGGNADDKTVMNYFTADGNGSVAWESYRTWNAEEHEYWHSLNGAPAVRMAKRVVNLTSPRLEDVSGAEILLNSKDIVYSWNQRHLGDSLLKINYNLQEVTEMHRRELTKARYMEGGYVTHLVSENDSPLIFRNGTEQYVSLDIVVHDLFDADGPTAAGAILGKGIVAYSHHLATVIPTVRQARSIAVKGGDIAWIDGTVGKGILSFATESVSVRTSNGVKTISGRLIKAPGSAAVYLAGTDGMRYSIHGEGLFYGWYPDFDSVRTVSAKTLSSMQLGGTVLYRPGSRLVKSRSANTVYAVGKNGTLLPLKDAVAAADIFGKNWKERIDVIGDAQLANYSIGRSVDSIVAYNAAVAGIRF